MGKIAALLLVLVFLTASCIIAAKPALSSVSIAENSWASKASMQVARGALGVAEVNSKIYAIGGSAQDVRLATTKEFLNTNEEYDPETNMWTFKKPMPTPRAAFATAVYQNKIYCIGGKTSSGYTGVNEVYDPATDTWETKTPMPTARGFLSASAVNGKIYLIGGSALEVWNLTEVYDPASDSWATKAPMPSVSPPASAVFDNKIYKIGSKLQIYDPETDEWSEGAPTPSNSSVSVAYGAGVTTGVLAPKRIYAVANDVWSGAYIVEVYDPENDTWAVGAKRPVTSYRDIMDFGVAIANDMLYVVGGYICDASYAISGIGIFTPLYSNEQYTPFGYGTIPPDVAVVSPEYGSYNSSSVSLTFSVSRLALWLGYSLDGQENVTVSGNTTITGLSNGLHNVTVYAKDEFGNTGFSETAFFTISVAPEPQSTEPFPTALVVASVVLVAVIGIGLLFYFKKRKHK
jgi:N-acetylneuraminic acid mutarotase